MSSRLILMYPILVYRRYEQLFVYHLLLHLKCNEVDAHYRPTHGLGAIPETRPRTVSKSRDRRR